MQCYPPILGPEPLSSHVKENQEISFTKGGMESGWPFVRFKLANYVTRTYVLACMFGTTTEMLG